MPVWYEYLAMHCLQTLDYRLTCCSRVLHAILYSVPNGGTVLVFGRKYAYIEVTYALSHYCGITHGHSATGSLQQAEHAALAHSGHGHVLPLTRRWATT